MKFTLLFLSGLTATAIAQTQTCTADMVKSDDCAAVIDANACYNQNRFAKGNGTLNCIDGKDNNDKARKVSSEFNSRFDGVLERKVTSTKCILLASCCSTIVPGGCHQLTDCCRRASAVLALAL